MQISGQHGLAAGHFLELFVSTSHTVTAHHGLDRLSQHFPCVVQVFGQTLFVQLQLVQAGHERGVSQSGVAQRHANVAQHSGVGQVTLPAADRQLFRQVLEQRVGQAQVAFGVFKVNRVDFVRHGGGANFARLQALLEVTQRDVAPNVAFKLGGGYGNLLSYGSFHHYKELGTLYTNPLVLTRKGVEVSDENKIEEKVDYAYYKLAENADKQHPVVPEPDMDKKEAYSWVKAPRYNGLPFEVGPLARLILSGHYINRISAMDRTIARALEAKKIADIMKILLKQIIPGVEMQQQYELPISASGRGLVDTTRGALGHWLEIQNQKISFYQIITPSTWDFSTRDENGYRGVAEENLMDY